MPWNTTCPVGGNSVKDNNSVIQDNITYIKTTMQNDHYWDEDATKDGYHKKVSLINQSPAPSLPAAMNGLIYAFVNVSTQPYFRNSADIMQLLGIRACAVFNASGTIAYSFNVTSVSHPSTGNFTLNFTNALPNNNYLVLGGAIRDTSSSGSSSSELIFEIPGASTLTNVKSTALVKVMCKSDGGTFHDPLQMWAVCFGG